MRDIVIKEYVNIQMEPILVLYNSVHWTNYTENPSMLEAAMRHSLKVLGAFHGDELIGMIRLIGDGFSIIYIQDIIVTPKYQRQGVGKMLMSEVDKLYPDVYQKVLLTDNKPQSIHFYESCGFSISQQLNCVAFLK